MVKCISISHFRAGTPLIVFLPIPLITHEVLYSPATSACIHNLVDVPLLGSIFSDDGPWASKFSIGEEEGVVRDVPFE
jgi:hypothetical protein